MSGPLNISERIAGAAAVLWLQVVGAVTGSVAHDIVHAIPLAVFLLLPLPRRAGRGPDCGVTIETCRAATPPHGREH